VWLLFLGVVSALAVYGVTSVCGVLGVSGVPGVFGVAGFVCVCSAAAGLVSVWVSLCSELGVLQCRC
jgi:hypothetical protein